MEFMYSCFISYRHGQQELSKSFMDQFTSALKGELECYSELDMYIDDDRETPGAVLEKKLAKALRQSVCMVFIYTPRYFSEEKQYCAREFLAMMKLQNHRFQKLGLQEESFIIPVILRGKSDFPKGIFGNEGEVLYADFEKFTLVDNKRILEHPDFYPQIEKIATHINARFKELQHSEPCEICETFELPNLIDTTDWIEKTLTHKKNTFPFRNG